MPTDGAGSSGQGTIHVPEGDRGDKVVMELIPNIHKMAEGKRDV